MFLSVDLQSGFVIKDIAILALLDLHRTGFYRWAEVWVRSTHRKVM